MYKDAIYLDDLHRKAIRNSYTFQNLVGKITVRKNTSPRLIDALNILSPHTLIIDGKRV